MKKIKIVFLLLVMVMARSFVVNAFYGDFETNDYIQISFGYTCKTHNFVISERRAMGNKDMHYVIKKCSNCSEVIEVTERHINKEKSISRYDTRYHYYTRCECGQQLCQEHTYVNGVCECGLTLSQDTSCSHNLKTIYAATGSSTTHKVVTRCSKCFISISETTESHEPYAQSSLRFNDKDEEYHYYTRCKCGQNFKQQHFDSGNGNCICGGFNNNDSTIVCSHTYVLEYTSATSISHKKLELCSKCGDIKESIVEGHTAIGSNYQRFYDKEKGLGKHYYRICKYCDEVKEEDHDMPNGIACQCGVTQAQLNSSIENCKHIYQTTNIDVTETNHKILTVCTNKCGYEHFDYSVHSVGEQGYIKIDDKQHSYICRCGKEVIEQHNAKCSCTYKKLVNCKHYSGNRDISYEPISEVEHIIRITCTDCGHVFGGPITTSHNDLCGYVTLQNTVVKSEDKLTTNVDEELKKIEESEEPEEFKIGIDFDKSDLCEFAYKHDITIEYIFIDSTNHGIVERCTKCSYECRSKKTHMPAFGEEPISNGSNTHTFVCNECGIKITKEHIFNEEIEEVRNDTHYIKEKCECGEIRTVETHSMRWGICFTCWDKLE